MSREPSTPLRAQGLRTRGIHSPSTVAVALDSRPLEGDDAFEVFARLRSEFGDNDVCLFESLGGPEADSHRAMIGIAPLFDLTVTEGRMGLTGSAALVDWAAERLRQLPVVTALDSGEFVLRARRDVWDVIRHLQSGFEVAGLDSRSFGFGFHTVLSYDAVSYIENIPQLITERGSDPDMLFRLYGATIDVDLPANLGQLTIAHGALWDAVDADRVIVAAARTETLGGADDVPAPGLTSSPIRTMEPGEYLDKALVALEHIRAGDIYQVQLGYEVTVPAVRDDLGVYRRLRAINPSPYMAFFPLGTRTVISGSPELHVRIENNDLTMRPIAGTARRTADEQQNAQNVAWLQKDAKEIAEHIMLVDLCRNDLGRVAVPGTVEVAMLMNVETYSHVYHLVSTVVARMEGGVDAYDVIRATFPAGTMTGAPKIRAMEIIETLENTRRGIYAGVFGVIGFGGFTNLALSIRTIVASDAGYTTRASAGVVVDSSPKSEWMETLAKMGSSIRAITNGDLS